MSSPSPNKVTCQGCGCEQDFIAWESLNVTLDRERKEELIKGDLTRFTCEKCGWSGQVDYPLLYHDMEKHLMIWLVCDGFEPDLSNLPFVHKMTDYRFRFVSSLNELIEKIVLFDAGFDDRLMEFFKLWMRAHPGEVVLLCELYFVKTTQDDDGSQIMHFEHFTNDTGERITVPLESFHQTCELVKSYFPAPETEAAKWLRVDIEYAKMMVH